MRWMLMLVSCWSSVLLIAQSSYAYLDEPIEAYCAALKAHNYQTLSAYLPVRLFDYHPKETYLRRLQEDQEEWGLLKTYQRIEPTVGTRNLNLKGKKFHKLFLEVQLHYSPFDHTDSERQAQLEQGYQQAVTTYGAEAVEWASDRSHFTASVREVRYGLYDPEDARWTILTEEELRTYAHNCKIDPRVVTAIETLR